MNLRQVAKFEEYTPRAVKTVRPSRFLNPRQVGEFEHLTLRTKEPVALFAATRGTGAEKLRRWERATNEYQLALGTAYDEWATDTADALDEAETDAERDEILDEALLALALLLKNLQREAVYGAVSLGTGGRPPTPALLQRVAGHLAGAEDAIESSLVSDIRFRVRAALRDPDVLASGAIAFLGVLMAKRARVESYAGVAWSTTQVAVGETAADAAEQGGDGRVGWQRDEQAKHCDTCLAFGEDAPGVREYESWDALLAETGGVVPGHGTTCDGNCRCSILVHNAKTDEWERPGDGVDLFYSEDQARDESGRWTDGGGGSSAENKGEGKGGRGGTGPGGGAGIATPFVVGQTPLPGHDAVRAAFDRGVEVAYSAAIRNGVIPATAGLEAVAAVGAKYLVTEQLAATMGVSPEVASNLVRQWAESSNGNDYRSLWMQAVAADEFGVPLSDWQRERLSNVEAERAEHKIADRVTVDMPIALIGVNPVRLMTPIEKERYATIRNLGPTAPDPFGGQKQEEVAGAFLRAQYDATQEYFKAAGVTEVVLYRGQRFPEGTSLSVGDVIPGNQNALNSWSSSEKVAATFTSIAPAESGVLAAVVPVDRILSTPFTGYGCLKEEEYVVLGNSDDKVAVHNLPVGLP